MLTRFQPPPPNPRYKQQPDWPQWGGVIQAPFDTFLQVPPAVRRPGPRVSIARGEDSVPVGVWLDSTGMRIVIEAICSDCGTVGMEGHYRGDSASGEWGQEFFGKGDSGTWTMRRAHDAPPMPAAHRGQILYGGIPHSLCIAQDLTLDSSMTLLTSDAFLHSR